LASTFTGPPHLLSGISATIVALLSARDCVEPASYRAVVSSEQSAD
jgi:hypothetical protein